LDQARRAQFVTVVIAPSDLSEGRSGSSRDFHARRL